MVTVCIRNNWEDNSYSWKFVIAVLVLMQLQYTVADRFTFKMTIFRIPLVPLVHQIAGLLFFSPSNDKFITLRSYYKVHYQKLLLLSFLDDPYYCGLSARVPKFARKPSQPPMPGLHAPLRKAHSGSYLSLVRPYDSGLGKETKTVFSFPISCTLFQNFNLKLSTNCCLCKIANYALTWTKKGQRSL